MPKAKATHERRQNLPVSFRLEAKMVESLAALSRATQRSQADIVRTGLLIMFKRARDMGILPAEGEAPIADVIPIRVSAG